MNELAVVIDDLTDLDLASVPPCEIIFVNRDTNHQFPCGKPSVIRMHMACSRCERKRTAFLCQACYDDLRKTKLSCWYCFTKTGEKPAICTYQES
jgi:hypothetical protein